MTVTGWSAAEVDGMDVADLNDWLGQAAEHAKAVREAQEAAMRQARG